MEEGTQENLQAKDRRARGTGPACAWPPRPRDRGHGSSDEDSERAGARESHPEGCRPAGSGSAAVTPAAAGQTGLLLVSRVGDRVPQTSRRVGAEGTCRRGESSRELCLPATVPRERGKTHSSDRRAKPRGRRPVASGSRRSTHPWEHQSQGRWREARLAAWVPPVGSRGRHGGPGERRGTLGHRWLDRGRAVAGCVSTWPWVPAPSAGTATTRLCTRTHGHGRNSTTEVQ